MTAALLALLVEVSSRFIWIALIVVSFFGLTGLLLGLLQVDNPIAGHETSVMRWIVESIYNAIF